MILSGVDLVEVITFSLRSLKNNKIISVKLNSEIFQAPLLLNACTV